MSDIPLRLLRPLASLSMILAGCANTASPLAVGSDDQSSREELTIDLSARTATTRQWRSDTIDCSDRDYFCILIPNRMVLVFAKSCSNAGREGVSSTRFGDLLGVAPAPHLAVPSGSYIVRSFPNVLLFYYVRNSLVDGEGLVEARIIRRSPFEEAFDPNDYSARYSITTSTGDGLFVCAP